MFRPLNFLSLQDVAHGLYSDPRSPLILIRQSGEAEYAKSPAEKERLVAQFKDGDLLLWPWQDNIGRTYSR
jgi:hypothetical protein